MNKPTSCTPKNVEHPPANFPSCAPGVGYSFIRQGLRLIDSRLEFCGCCLIH